MTGHTQPPRQRGPLRNRVRRAWRVLRGRPLVYGAVIGHDGTFKAFSQDPQDEVLVEGCLIHITDPGLPEGLADLDGSRQARQAAQRMLNQVTDSPPELGDWDADCACAAPGEESCPCYANDPDGLCACCRGGDCNGSCG
jgi:hypothetical protein